MKQCQVIQEMEAEQLKSNIPAFRVGDTICVHQRIIEGEKERVQQFTGTVIARRGSGISETVSLYRFSYGAGVERVFLINSPKISKIEVMKSGDVRKSKLYYLRGSSGKASKVKEQIGPGKGAAKAAAVAEESTPAT
ncbi:MAG: 50S ribosomal protein L19 [Verrucomicrobia bacterium]|nr:50S ribosomal protein L19 [Verrucomicrobiota bacterium]